jgi:hypothetical protein
MSRKNSDTVVDLNQASNEQPVQSAETQTQTQTQTQTPGAEAAPAPVAGTRGKAVILPSGEKRVDYIKRRYYKEGASRSDIAKELTSLQGVTVPYQIVFAATKEKRAVQAPAPAAEATSEQPAAEQVAEAATE